MSEIPSYAPACQPKFKKQYDSGSNKMAVLRVISDVDEKGFIIL